MTKEYDNTNRGVLFKNDNKEKETHADYDGSLNVAGQDYWINAWVKEGKSGRKFFSLSVKEKKPVDPKETKSVEDMGQPIDTSDIPF